MEVVGVGVVVGASPVRHAWLRGLLRSGQHSTDIFHHRLNWRVVLPANLALCDSTGPRSTLRASAISRY